ncbi:MAG: hypothetical protein HY858_03455 [Candidatus Solibacter usitatus]|nr:hypothetical protein [Candidatus Solibacter usitatus]
MRLRALLLSCSFAASAETAAGLQWKAPSGWVSQAARPMRAATYSVPAAAGDEEKPECAVYFFGAGQGGSVEANLARWQNQFLTADGKPAKPTIRKRTIRGLPVTTIESAGRYTGAAGPAKEGKIVKSGYRLLGAIVEGPGGAVFIKFAASAATIEANAAKFEELLSSFEREANMAGLLPQSLVGAAL